MDSIPMMANANRCCRNVGRIVAIDSSRSSAIGCSVKLFSKTAFLTLSILLAEFYGVKVQQTCGDAAPAVQTR